MVRGRHFEHEKINAGIMLDVFETKIVPMVFMKEHGVQIYPGGGKNPFAS